MKLAQSVLVATVLHGIVFGVAAAVLPGRQPARSERAPIEVDVVAPTPDPMSASLPSGPVRAPPLDAPKAPVPAHRHRPAPAAALATTLHSVNLAPSLAPAPTGAPAAQPAITAKGAASATTLAPSAPGVIASAKPRYRSNPVPEYPVPSRRRREEGIVYLNVTVEPTGWPAAVSLNRSSGFPLLDQAAIDAVRRWVFEPGRAGGVPVSSQVVVPVRFFLSESP